MIGVADESELQVYSIAKLRNHEIANINLGSKPIAVGYGPLANLPTVRSRRIDDVILHLAPSGWTYENTFVLYDLETETLWYSYKDGLMGIQGYYFKRWLKKIPSHFTRWKKWK